MSDPERTRIRIERKPLTRWILDQILGLLERDAGLGLLLLGGRLKLQANANGLETTRKLSAFHDPGVNSLGHLNGPLTNEGGFDEEELDAAQEIGRVSPVDHSGGPSYIAERLDVFSNKKKNKGGLLFSEVFILNMMNLVGKDHNFG